MTEYLIPKRYYLSIYLPANAMDEFGHTYPDEGGCLHHVWDDYQGTTLETAKNSLYREYCLWKEHTGKEVAEIRSRIRVSRTFRKRAKFPEQRRKFTFDIRRLQMEKASVLKDFDIREAEIFDIIKSCNAKRVYQEAAYLKHKRERLTKRGLWNE